MYKPESGMKKIINVLFVVLIFISMNTGKLFSEPRNVLIEYLTGTWCGNCPCGHQTLSSIVSMYPQTIILAYHGFSNDPWRQFNGNGIINLLGFSATPTADIDRGNVVSLGDYSQWITGVQNRYNSSPDTRINLTVTSKIYDEATRLLNISFDATALGKLQGQYKINFVISENNLIYQQNFYSQCGTPGYVQDYVHGHVVRTMLNGESGENLNSNNLWNINQTITKTISASIDNSWVAGNCNIVAFIYKDSPNLAYAEVEQAKEESVTGTVGINGDPDIIPDGYSLSQNFPNPFNPVTNIKFYLPLDGNVSFKVYDIFGKEVENYSGGFMRKGSYNVQFNGENLASGIYFYSLKAGSYFDRKKMILIK